MDRRFLQNLNVGGEGLPKEVVDAIMAENGRDIEAAKGKFSDYSHLREQLEQAELALKEAQDQGKTLEQVRTAARQWQEKYEKAQQEYSENLNALAFQQTVEKAVQAAKGRNAKAISALLDMESLKKSEDRDSAVTKAVNGLKEEFGYLFEQEPPLYAGGTGAQTEKENRGPATLAGALREKYERMN